ncbi:MAG: hypothetical protein J5709_10235 [Bacteroidales bacterium]|nr:hypothetical protein [Bacteroidales bacterium]
MNIHPIYSSDFPEFIKEIAQSPAMLRLDDIGMNCGCEYTSFPMFAGLEKYSRYYHSIGVALIVWHFTHDKKQSTAGLLHDISSPAFAHVIDFMHGDYLTQESTENGTQSIIENSAEIQQSLKKYGMQTSEVADYHLYPIADNDTPRLSADRLEYTIGNIVNYKLASYEKAKELYDDLIVGTNEEGQPEIMFSDKDKALEFAKLSLQCSRIYVADEDRYSMQRLAEILKECIIRGIITESDLYLGETPVIEKLMNNDFSAKEWQKFRSYSTIVHTADNPDSRVIYAKKRHINPYISGLGRVGNIFPEYGKALKEYLEESQDYAICGTV